MMRLEIINGQKIYGKRPILNQLNLVFQSGKIYGALGSGDTFYDKFCQSVLDFDEQFAKTGATKGAENVLVDLNAEEEDVKNIEAFAKSLVEKLG